MKAAIPRIATPYHRKFGTIAVMAASEMMKYNWWPTAHMTARLRLAVVGKNLATAKVVAMTGTKTSTARVAVLDNSNSSRLTGRVIQKALPSAGGSA